MKHRVANFFFAVLRIPPILAAPDPDPQKIADQGSGNNNIIISNCGSQIRIRIKILWIPD